MDIFHKPVIRSFKKGLDIIPLIHKLAEKNIPFIVENHDGEEKIVHDEIDVEAVSYVESELGINLVR